jgi:hypothetical protein
VIRRALRDASHGDDDGGAVAEEALVGGDADAGAFDLATFGLAAHLPGQLADGLTGIRPPIVVAPERSRFSASPFAQRPMCSYQSNSNAVDRS